MTVTEELKDAFTYWQRKYPCGNAVTSLKRAREDVANNVKRYPREIAHGAQCFKPDAQGLQWCNPDEIGLRFVGWQDELRVSRDSHQGWYIRAGDWDEVYRACVYQLPARNGKAIFIPGYREGSNSKRGWSDTCGEHSAALDFRDLYSCDDADSAKRDAARTADSLAEYAAEKSREYDEAWQAGSQYYDLGENIKSDRKHILQICAELRKAQKQITVDAPAICKTLRANIRKHYHDIQKAREERAELIDSVWHEYRDAFNEGANEKVFNVTR